MIERTAFASLAVPLLASAIGAAACGDSSSPTTIGIWTPNGTPSSSGAIEPGGSSGGGESSSGTTSASSSASGGGSSSGSGSGGSSSSSGSSGSSGSPAGNGSGTLPCDVASVLGAKCTSCHANPPVAMSLVPLLTYSDLLLPSIEVPTMNEAQLSVLRMQSAASPMPPASLMLPATPSDIATLQSWIAAGYPSGACSMDAGASSGGSSSSGGPVDVFAQQPAYVAKTGGGAHNAGRDCNGCHGFGVAGTIYSAQGTPLAGAEIRVLDSQGNAYSVYSGTNGNFYGGDALVVPPAHIGARDAKGATMMVGPIAYGGCNKCHCASTGCTTTRLHLP